MPGTTWEPFLFITPFTATRRSVYQKRGGWKGTKLKNKSENCKSGVRPSPTCSFDHTPFSLSAVRTLSRKLSKSIDYCFIIAYLRLPRAIVISASLSEVGWILGWTEVTAGYIFLFFSEKNPKK